jgi:hypothetical protein
LRCSFRVISIGFLTLSIRKGCNFYQFTTASLTPSAARA